MNFVTWYPRATWKRYRRFTRFGMPPVEFGWVWCCEDNKFCYDCKDNSVCC